MTRVHRVGPSFRRRLTRFSLIALCGLMPAAVLARSAPPDQAAAPQVRTLTADATFADRDWSDQVPAHLSVVDGRATIERDGRVEDAEANTPLLAGDRLRTERGRIEVLYGDGSSLGIDEYSAVDLLDDSLIRLGGGRVRLAIVRTGGALTYRVDAAGATTWIRTPGEYRVAVTDPRAQYPEVTLVVYRGSAELETPLGRTLVRAGMASATTARTEPSVPFTVNAAAGDAFDRWVDDQQRARLGYESARYLPEEIHYYSGYFDRYGSWEYQPTYGYVWYPTVAVGWRPYYDGRWSVFGSLGWFWVGGGAGWTYPTHHYGRWGSHGSRWYWIPDRRWSPAWVSWAYAPGYVSWCPLGYNGLPVYGFGYGGYRDHWRAWSVAPSHAFASRAVPRHTFISGDHISASTSTQFVERGGPPTRPASIRADVAPIRSPGAASRRVAVPRVDGGVAGPARVGASPTSRTLAPAIDSASPSTGGIARSRAPLTERGPMIDQQSTRSTAASRAPINRQEPRAGSIDSQSIQPGSPRAVERRVPAPTGLSGYTRTEPSSTPLRSDRYAVPSRRIGPIDRATPPDTSMPDPSVGTRSFEPRGYSSAPLDRPTIDRLPPSRMRSPVEPRSQPDMSQPAPDRRGAVSRSGSSAPQTAPAPRDTGGGRTPSRVAPPRGSAAPAPSSGTAGGRGGR